MHEMMQTDPSRDTPEIMAQMNLLDKNLESLESRVQQLFDQLRFIMSEPSADQPIAKIVDQPECATPMGRRLSGYNFRVEVLNGIVLNMIQESQI